MERARGEVRMASCKSRIGGRHGSYYLKWALPEQEEEQRRGEGGETEHRGLLSIREIGLPWRRKSALRVELEDSGARDHTVVAAICVFSYKMCIKCPLGARHCARLWG